MGQVIQVSTRAAVEVTAFHKDVFEIARTGHRAAETMAKKMQALITSRYGKTAPTFEQYRADRAALKQLAAEKKLADDQWLRKPYCAALKALYGALPEAQTAEAIAKRAQREAAEKAKKEKAGQEPDASKTGPKDGATQDRQPSEAEQIEALVARIGVFKALEACIAILAADDSTKAQAVHMKAQAAKAAAMVAKTAEKKVA